MKLVSYLHDDQEHLGLVLAGHLYNLHTLHKGLPHTMKEFLESSDGYMDRAYHALENLIKQPNAARAVPFYELIAPVPHPSSCRDGYAFSDHVHTARRNRGLDMIPEFNQFPVFYFTNHQAIQGPGDVWLMRDHFDQLDFELEVAIVIGKQGRNIPAASADEHIAGYMIMNDLSARRLQREEMKFNLGPAKGKDFATTTGPWLVTPDELESFQIDPFPGHSGKAFALEMRCWVNGNLVSHGNLRDMNWTFAELIERASYGVELYPGDVIGSGTVGTGCLLELNGSKRLSDPNQSEIWLQDGDLIEMEVTGLGHLSNTVRRLSSDWSIFANSEQFKVSHGYQE